MKKHMSLLDRLIAQADSALRATVPGAAEAIRPSPAKDVAEKPMTKAESRHAAGLMRINHTGEVCAQGLYQGQAMTARLPEVRDAMEQAALEEVDHLSWCETRLEELGARPSVLNPLFYGMSFAIGAAAGAISDRASLGFVAATENQVCKHLSEHLESLPPQDERSRKVLEQMLEDEARHEALALSSGGQQFPAPVRDVMTLASRVMTRTTYRI
jgi:ubiquinone biosynthesis monooxygenase Coq7